VAEQFDEAMVDRIAREVYGNTVVDHSGPHSRKISLAFLNAISATHAIVPLAEYEALEVKVEQAKEALHNFLWLNVDADYMERLDDAGKARAAYVALGGVIPGAEDEGDEPHV
jgi:hypothetical protein